MDAVVYYRVSNAIVSVTNVKDTHHSTKYFKLPELIILTNIAHWRLLAQTSLRNILGTKNLHEILSDRDSIAGAMQVILNHFYPTSYLIPSISYLLSSEFQHLLDEATADWGIKVERVEM